MRKTIRSAAAAVAAGIVAIGIGMVSAPASAYQPSPSAVYTATNPSACNKRPCVLYPKSAQLPSGRIVAAYEDDESAVVGQTIPIRASDDNGATWKLIASVKPPAQLSSSAAVSKYTSAWTNPYLYVLPTAVGNLKAGTLLLAAVVSGDDQYAAEQKAADPSWQPSGDGDRQDVAIALYASTDAGASWGFQNIIATGGWQGGSAGSIGRTSAANSFKQVDPVWEPYLMAYSGRLVAYYSDENDYLSVGAGGVPQLDPSNATASDSGGQILAHRTWDGTSSGWSAPVVDVAGDTVDRGSGKTEIGGGRPGMETVVPTTDGKWMATFEYFGGGDNVHYKIASDPLSFGSVSGVGSNITSLPTAGPALATGGSPVLVTALGGSIVYNAAGSGAVWVNASGSSTGTWKEYQTAVPAGYSRNLQPVSGTKQLLILQAAWAGGAVGPVVHGDVDLGHSAGTYYSIVNRKTGQYLSTDADKTQDANLTGDKPDIISWTNNASNDTQRWHEIAKGSNFTFLNKAGGRALAIWQGTANSGAQLAQWVDDDAADKRWTVTATSSGYYRIQPSANPNLSVSGAAANGAITLQTTDTSDQSQEWQLIAQ